jgi:ribosomal protein S1
VTAAKKVSKTQKTKGKTKVNKSSVKVISESSVMEKLLAKHEAEVKSYSQGDKVKGKIQEITPKRVVVDIGGKSEAIVAEKAYKEAESYIKTLKVGDVVEASIIIPETYDGFTILSFRHASANASWKRIETAEKDGTPLRVDVRSVLTSGLMVNVGGLTGFVPRSQLGKDIVKDLDSLVGKKINAVVIDTDRSSNKVVLSEKEVSEAEELAIVRDAIKNIKEGEVYEGVVTTIYDFGCFVTIKAGKKKSKDKVELDGLVHISELSWDKIGKPDDEVKVGEKVKVKVIGKTKGKLALSIKQTIKDPWDTIEKKYKKDQKVDGKVVKQSDFGVFIQLEPGVEGLIHLTKIPPGKKLGRGDKVNVYIEEVDKKEKRISLGLVLTAKPVGYK